jgi:hypothetical protein
MMPASLSLVPARKHSLVEHLSDVEAIQTTLESLDDDAMGPEAREDLERMLMEAIAGTRVKVDRTAAILSVFETATAAATAEAVRLKARAEYFERQRKRLETYVLAVMSASGLKKLDGATSTLASRNNPASVVIDDESRIPWDFFRVPEPRPDPPPAPDKKLIAQALRAGSAVEGARLVASQRLVRS